MAAATSSANAELPPGRLDEAVVENHVAPQARHEISPSRLISIVDEHVVQASSPLTDVKHSGQISTCSPSTTARFQSET